MTRSPNEIVLVGNGPSVLNTALGQQIDEFTNIVRFNGFVLNGFEKHIGCRTTIWSRWYRLETMQEMDKLDSIWLNMPAHERTTQNLSMAMTLLGCHAKKAKIIPTEKLAKELQLTLFGAVNTKKWPSSGLLAIAHAVYLGLDVSIIGFDSWATEPFHYYGQHDRTNSHHVADIERQYIADLINDHKVVRLGVM